MSKWVSSRSAVPIMQRIGRRVGDDQRAARRDAAGRYRRGRARPTARSTAQTISGLPAKLVAIGRWTWPAIIADDLLAGSIDRLQPLDPLLRSSGAHPVDAGVDRRMVEDDDRRSRPCARPAARSARPRAVRRSCRRGGPASSVSSTIQRSPPWSCSYWTKPLASVGTLRQRGAEIGRGRHDCRSPTAPAPASARPARPCADRRRCRRHSRPGRRSPAAASACGCISFSWSITMLRRRTLSSCGLSRSKPMWRSVICAISIAVDRRSLAANRPSPPRALGPCAAALGFSAFATPACASVRLRRHMCRAEARGKAAQSRIALVIGTRPEAIKLAPGRACACRSRRAAAPDRHRPASRARAGRPWPCRLRATPLDCPGQPDPHAPCRAGRGRRCGGCCRIDPPDLLVVQGDTSSALGGALAARDGRHPARPCRGGPAQLTIPAMPWPEEENRIAIDAWPTCCSRRPTTNAANLRREERRRRDPSSPATAASTRWPRWPALARQAAPALAAAAAASTARHLPPPRKLGRRADLARRWR